MGRFEDGGDRMMGEPCKPACFGSFCILTSVPREEVEEEQFGLIAG